MNREDDLQTVWDEIASEWPDLPDPLPADPFDEDGYCEFCGNGRWKYHAPWCKWRDAVEACDPPSTVRDTEETVRSVEPTPTGLYTEERL